MEKRNTSSVSYILSIAFTVDKIAIFGQIFEYAAKICEKGKFSGLFLE